MKFKSALGMAALEEFNEEDQAPGAGESGEAKTDGADGAAAAAAPASGEAGAAGGEAGAAGGEAGGEGGESGAAAGAAGEGGEAGGAAAGAAEGGAAEGGEAGAGAGEGGETGAAAGGEAGEGGDPAASAAAATSADDTQAAQAAAAATSAAEATGEPAAAAGGAEGEDVGEAEAEEVEGEMEAVDQIEDKEGDVQEDVEKLEAATESLEGCVAILDAAAQRGGLDIYGASLLRNNVNTVTRSLKVKNLMLPALEDMETPSAKIDGANNAKDQVVAFIKRILAAIGTAFDNLAKWAVETYQRLTNAFVAVERRAEKLSERVKNSKMKDGSIDSKSLATKMSVNGAPVKDIAGFVANLGKAAEKLNDPKAYKQYLEALALCEELVKNPEKDEEIRGKISGVLARWASEMEKSGDDRSLPEGTSVEGCTSFGVSLFDNQVLVTSIPNSTAGIGKMSSVVASTKKAEGASLPALNSNEATKVCAQVLAVAKAVREASEGNRGGVKELNTEIKKYKDTIAALSQSHLGSAAAEGGIAAKARQVMLFINSILMVTPKMPIHAINRALPRNLSYALDYVAASLAGAPAEAAAPAGAAA
ncbi:hypothetical protein [Ralstonia phage RP31]|uniref:Uncharacterized protein n=2 Tax=Ripduovirus RP12 TaxID=2560700 RepID=A0A1L7N165_9CAUD|nr:hypothetical protein FDH28_gp180 [Ralstonia phage RP12]BAW19215.1 hypothetical protein [Ralstonia phage RP12]BAW19501.1 hypothetical protein [Ralstonia phage RP31]